MRVTKVWYEENGGFKTQDIPEFALYQPPRSPQGTTQNRHRVNFVRYTRRYCRLWCKANRRQFNANWRFFI